MNTTNPSHLPRSYAPVLALQTPAQIPAPRRRRKPSAPRNFIVFPVQLDQPRPSLEAFPFTTYSAFDLKARHMYDRNLARGIDDIWIDTANYYKQRQSSRHEFIIFSIASSTGMRNFLALDRNGYIQGSSGLGGSGKNKLGFPAQDYFHISHYGEMESLVSHCGRNTPKSQYTHIEHLGFASTALPFAQILVLANTVSEWEPGYKSNTNDHWFAGLVWECLIGVFGSGIIRHKRFSDERGRTKGFKVSRHQEDYQQVVKKYKEETATFKNGLADDAKKPEVVDPLDLQTTHTIDGQAPLEESHHPPKSPFLITAPVSAPRSKIMGKESSRKLERMRTASLYANSKYVNAPSTIDPHLRTRLNKELPSLPPDAEPHIPRSRAKSLNNSMKGQKRRDPGDVSPADPNDHVATTVLHGTILPPLPPRIPREFSWIKVEPQEWSRHQPQRNNRTYRCDTAYSLPLTSSNTRIPQGHLKQRTRST
ncbi:unnamed protein product [Rhizoctonia solani]|uniref:Uncharacterized protein n=1 Tax=Rhizoctonia solani TaxID=456999 RepID=A0A8H3GHL4_9AGAM|nr:unnamed protein product [Rhizoctonia solani]